MTHAPAIVRIPRAPTKASAQNGVGYLLRRICPLLLRFSDAGQPHAGSQPQAQPAGVRKPAENETAGDDARSSSSGLWGFEGAGWRDGDVTRCELSSLRGR